jgi:ubiquinone/menaquinone biosynthesis C-methylase UbiE
LYTITMDPKGYWNKKHIRYAAKDWIDKPTIFSQFAIQYFPKTGTLLDLGAGHGQDSRFFAKKGYSVTGTDFSETALRFLAEKADKEGLRIKTEQVDLSKNLPFENNKFDVVYAHLSLHYFDVKTTDKLFSEIQRILKPNGILAALFNSVDDPEIPRFEKVDDDYYLEPGGIIRRYFSVQSAQKFIVGKFEPIILDNEGETYKDSIKSLIRFIGHKI